jgi:hypothetical protein
MISVISLDITTANGASIGPSVSGTELDSINAVITAPPGSVILSVGYDFSALSTPGPSVVTIKPSLDLTSWTFNVTGIVDLGPAGVTYPPPDGYVFCTIYAVCATTVTRLETEIS